ncbi:DUF488 domain-containing protein [candidate division WOR-3 bacterium]|nr:DUF488 domain-containing protein [candidate division WOR-3 bacterium]
MKVFSLGTAGRASFDFTRLLAKYGIEVIFDLRRVPESRLEHFNRDRLAELCSAQDVSYIYIGNELGAPVGNDLRAWRESDGFTRWLGIIRSKVEKRVCCLLCAEHSPENCRRRVLAAELGRGGIEVVHLLDEGVFWTPPPPRPAPSRRPAQRPGSRPRRPHRR